MKWVKRILIAVVVLLLIAGGVFYYLWSQATYVPDWYAEEQAAGAPEPGATAPNAAPAWKDAPGAAPGKRKELRNFHRRAANKDPTVAKVIKASRASFEDGTLEMGVVADLRQLPHDKLAAGQRELFEKVRASFPSATDREIYIGVEDPAPVLAGGQIELGPQARLRIGKLGYDLDAAAQKLGMTSAALRAQFNQQIRGLGVTAPSP
jgi:hypothetical protein